MENKSTVSKGLFLLFVASIVGLFSAIPLIGVVAGLASIIIKVYGLFTIKEEHANFNTAFMVVIVALVLNVLSAIFKDGFLGTLVSIAVTVANLFYIYLICATVDEMAAAKAVTFSPKGDLVWRLSLIANIIVIAALVILFVPFLLAVAGIAALVGGIIALVAGIMMMVLLYQSSKALA